MLKNPFPSAINWNIVTSAYLDIMFGHHAHPWWPKKCCVGRQLTRFWDAATVSQSISIFSGGSIRSCQHSCSSLEIRSKSKRESETMSSWYTTAKNNIPCESLSLTPGNGHEKLLKKSSYSGKWLFNNHIWLSLWVLLFYLLFMSIKSREKTTSGCQWACGGIWIAIRVGGILW